MRIKQIETIRIESQPQIIWVQIHTDTGIIGLGETFYAPQVVEAAVHDWFGPLLIGREPGAIERHWEAMFRLSDHAGYGGAEMRAISAIDMALWDIKGQAVDLPIYELLGGAVRTGRIRLYCPPQSWWKNWRRWYRRRASTWCATTGCWRRMRRTGRRSCRVRKGRWALAAPTSDGEPTPAQRRHRLTKGGTSGESVPI